MQIQDITTRTMITAACRVHQTGRIVSLCPFSRFFRFKLSPCFVERYPYADARIRIQVVDNFFSFFAIVSF